jgi:hypothetical protein
LAPQNLDDEPAGDDEEEGGWDWWYIHTVYHVMKEFPCNKIKWNDLQRYTTRSKGFKTPYNFISLQRKVMYNKIGFIRNVIQLLLFSLLSFHLSRAVVAIPLSLWDSLQIYACQVEPLNLTLWEDDQRSYDINKARLVCTYIIVIASNHLSIGDLLAVAVKRLIWINGHFSDRWHTERVGRSVLLE